MLVCVSSRVRFATFFLPVKCQWYTIFRLTAVYKAVRRNTKKGPKRRRDMRSSYPRVGGFMGVLPFPGDITPLSVDPGASGRGYSYSSISSSASLRTTFRNVDRSRNVRDMFSVSTSTTSGVGSTASIAFTLFRRSLNCRMVASMIKEPRGMGPGVLCVCCVG